jgi:hypothetical protein
MDAPLCKGKAASKVIDCGVAINFMVQIKNPITLKKRYRVGPASLAVFWDR